MQRTGDLLRSYPSRFKSEKAGSANTTVHFILSGTDAASFTVEVKAGNCFVYESLQGAADCTVHADAQDYLSVENGTLNPQTAFIEGKIKVDNPGVMLEFARYFRRLASVPNEKPSAESKAVKAAVSNRKPTQGPLQGLRVIDMSRLLPAPYACMLLADMGAEVIKVEKPEEPDYIRSYPPTLGTQSAFYMAVNRSKKSLTLDTGTQKGKAWFFELVKTADVLVESFRPGVMQAAGLDYATLNALNPKLIYASVTGYGQTGPYAMRAGHDLNYMAISGLLSLSDDGKGNPAMPGVQLADIAGGSYATVNSILAALYSRSSTGKGQHLDIAMTEAVMPLSVLASASMYATGEDTPRGQGLLAGGLANYNIYQCADGRYMALGALEPKFWNRFCEAVQKQEWIARIIPGPDHTLLKEELQILFRTQDASYWTKLGHQHDCCLTPVLELSETQKDIHLKERKMDLSTDDIPGIGIPVKFRGTPAAPSWKAPELGEDTESVLIALGADSAEIERLRAGKII